MLYLAIVILFAFFAGVAMTVQEGIWNNSVNFLAITFSGIVAALAGSPVGALMQEKFGNKSQEQAWYFTFAGTWLVFALSVTVLRLLTERLSRVRVKFVPPAEMVAGPLVGLMASCMLASFTAFTLYSMPMRAGEWDFSQGSPWQQWVFKSGSGPFYYALSHVATEEVAKKLISP